MNGVHDMGGMDCYGPINLDPNEPMFHADWEKRVLAMTVAMGATGEWNIDRSRSEREQIPPADYLSIGYYRIWLRALENLLVQQKLVHPNELASGSATEPAKAVKRKLNADSVHGALAAGSPVERPASHKAQFAIGDTVFVIKDRTPKHTRLPAYIRGQCGTITRVHGYHVFADSHAESGEENPQWLYNVRFSSHDLWGDDTSIERFIYVDCWEPYLKTAS